MLFGAAPAAHEYIPVAVEDSEDEARTVAGDEDNSQTERASKSTAESPSPEAEQRFRLRIAQLRDAIDAYKSAKNGNSDGIELKEHEENVLRKMNEAADTALDPMVKSHYQEKARKFIQATTKDEKETVLTGVWLILATPLALAFVGLVASGAMLYGVGTLLREIGNVCSFGWLAKGRKWWNERVERRNVTDWDEDIDMV